MIVLWGIVVFHVFRSNAISTDIRVVKLGNVSVRWDDLPQFVKGEHVYAEPDLRQTNGNPGDLIYRFREQNDQLQIREVIVLPELISDVQEVRWYVTTTARRITSVRVLNFGRERAYTQRIDVAGNEAQTIFQVPSTYDPRVMIEVYGI